MNKINELGRWHLARLAYDRASEAAFAVDEEITALLCQGLASARDWLLGSDVSDAELREAQNTVCQTPIDPPSILHASSACWMALAVIRGDTAPFSDLYPRDPAALCLERLDSATSVAVENVARLQVPEAWLRRHGRCFVLDDDREFTWCFKNTDARPVTTVEARVECPSCLDNLKSDPPEDRLWWHETRNAARELSWWHRVALAHRIADAAVSRVQNYDPYVQRLEAAVETVYRWLQGEADCSNADAVLRDSYSWCTKKGDANDDAARAIRAALACAGNRDREYEPPIGMRVDVTVDSVRDLPIPASWRLLHQPVSSSDVSKIDHRIYGEYLHHSLRNLHDDAYKTIFSPAADVLDMTGVTWRVPSDPPRLEVKTTNPWISMTVHDEVTITVPDGGDPYLTLAAEAKGISYESARDLLNSGDEEITKLRHLWKILMFNFLPSGMSSSEIIESINRHSWLDHKTPPIPDPGRLREATDRLWADWLLIWARPVRRCETCGTDGRAVTCPPGHPDLREVFGPCARLRPWPVPIGPLCQFELSRNRRSLWAYTDDGGGAVAGAEAMADPRHPSWTTDPLRDALVMAVFEPPEVSDPGPATSRSYGLRGPRYWSPED